MTRVLLPIALVALIGWPLASQGRPRQQSTGTVRATGITPVIQRPADIDFALIQRAMSKLRFESRQLRRVRDGSQQGDWLGVRELLRHDVDSNQQERFELEYIPPETEGLSRAELLHRGERYANNAGFIYSYQSFRVHDVDVAEANYRVYPFLRTQRLGRQVERVLVYPVRWDRSIWLLDLDVETGYPLYCGEYNNQIQLLSEIVVEGFETGETVVNDASRWKPRMLVTSYDSVDIALQDLGNRGPKMIREDIEGLPPGYRRIKTQIVEPLARDEKSLVHVFSDGIDTVFLVQTSGAENPFAELGISSADTNAISAYRDLNMAQYTFYSEDVQFLIVGRSSLIDLRSTVEAVYRQAVRY